MSKKHPRADDASLAIVRALNACAKRKDAKHAMELFEHHAGAGTALPVPAYHTLLSLLDLDDASRAKRVRRHMRDNKVPADETTVTLEVRALVQQGDLAGAVDGLRSAEAEGISPKHRTFSALLHALCERGDVDAALSVLAQMRRIRVDPDEVDLVQTAALMASVRDDAAVEAALRALQELAPRLRRSSLDTLQSALDEPSKGHRAAIGTVNPSGKCSSCGARVAA
eukprot:1628788-Prymnesium_polylepis.1